ncbi:MAG: ParA family protein [Nitrospinales bacterium]
MAIISIIGPKGGIGKTTLSTNTAAALTNAVNPDGSTTGVCLVDLDLRLPTVASILDSHPKLTFFDLFSTLANKTFQADFLRSLYQLISIFKRYLDGSTPDDDERLLECINQLKNLNPALFLFSKFKFGDLIHQIFLTRGEIKVPKHLKQIEELLNQIDMREFREILRETEMDSKPDAREYVSYIEEYGFSVLGGEVPVLGKKEHRKRINEPEFLLAFLDFLNEVFKSFKHVIVDTPAGGVNHISSLMNVLDQVIFIFDLSNPIAVNGSIDAMHSFIDYYEDFFQDYLEGKLTGLDKEYVSRLISERGVQALEDSLQNKKMGIMLNRCSDTESITAALNNMRGYLDVLNKYEKYKNRIHIMGMIPNHKIINITSHKGTLFYHNDTGLKNRMDLAAKSIITNYKDCPTLSDNDSTIIRYLQKSDKSGFTSRLSRIAGITD